MLYYVMLVKIYNDGTDDKKALYEHKTLESALAAFHSYLGGAIGADTISSILCKVINSVGGVHATEYWAAETEEDTTEETTEE